MNTYKKTNELLKKILIIFTLIFPFYFFYKFKNENKITNPKKVKIYWFIPDGLRADRDQFNIFEWANQNELPNLKKLMALGSYGYSRPVFPGHTPTNFATLLTGVYPDKHGIADGAMRTFGYPLKMVSKGGFTSFAKLVEPIWVEAENENYLVTLQSVPGSTPPDIFNGNVIKGRWGGWGVEIPSLVLQTNSKSEENLKTVGNNRRAFLVGPELSKYVDLPNDKKIEIDYWGIKIFLDSSQSRLNIKFNDVVLNLNEGEWSKWIPTKFKYQIKNDYQMSSPKKSQIENELSAVEIESSLKFKLISLDKDGNYRLRILANSLNEFLTEPEDLSKRLNDKLGPMIDFVDNYPPQLVYHQNDKQTFLEEALESWNWHINVVPILFKDLKSDLVIHSTYNPNQMLTSRWWLPYIDKDSEKYQDISEINRSKLWAEVKDMYKNVDKILGKIIESADENTYIVFSSDHGAIPLNKEVKLNNLFAKKGWLKFIYNKKTSNYEIDWDNTKVIYLQMNNIYINPKGLGGIYRPNYTKEYNQLRNEVIQELVKLKDPENGKKVLSYFWPREEVKKISLPEDRVGDLVIANSPGFNWSEDLNEDLEVFGKSLKGGYKQALVPKDVEGLLTPFVIMGPGINSGHKINDIINHVDQYATIAKILKLKHPTKPIIDGKVLDEVFIK